MSQRTMPARRGCVSRCVIWTTAIAVSGGVWGLLAAPVQAQRPRLPDSSKIKTVEKGVKETRIIVELMTGPEGVGIKAQEWARTFEELDVVVTVRRQAFEEEPEVKEKMVGTTLREVTAQGKLEKDGTVKFANRQFRPGEIAKLKEWLKELRTYGAQGSPNGQPVWGLSKTQFEPLFQVLSEPLAEEPQGEEVTQALELFRMGDQYPIQLTRTAEEFQNRQSKSPVVGKSLRGIAKGTALALMLGDAGLGFRPRRTPDSRIELAVVPLQEGEEVWPIGWRLKQKGPDVAPELFKIVRINLEDEPLTDVLDAAADVMKIPMFIDEYGLKQRNIDLSKITVSHPPKQTTWSSALNSFVFKARLRRDILMDEQGKPFVWITPLAMKGKTEK